MAVLLQAFKAVAVIFPFLAIGTGAQGLLDPIGFSRSFGLPIVPSPAPSRRSSGPSTSSVVAPPQICSSSFATSYVSLMSIRQLAAGAVLGVFAYQRKWTESATMLTIIGPLQAGTDAWFLARGGTVSAGLFHAIPGLIISGLAANYLYFYA